jgi:hypothetical protein
MAALALTRVRPRSPHSALAGVACRGAQFLDHERVPTDDRGQLPRAFARHSHRFSFVRTVGHGDQLRDPASLNSRFPSASGACAHKVYFPPKEPIPRRLGGFILDIQRASSVGGPLMQPQVGRVFSIERALWDRRNDPFPLESRSRLGLNGRCIIGRGYLRAEDAVGRRMFVPGTRGGVDGSQRTCLGSAAPALQDEDRIKFTATVHSYLPPTLRSSWLSQY